MSDIHVFYRISDSPAWVRKEKPSFINNENCLNNFLLNFTCLRLYVIADSVGEQTKRYLISQSERFNFAVDMVDHGSGSKTFSYALDLALERKDGDIIYFVEDDFLHLPASDAFLVEAFHETEADYVTLYDHPDKYENAEEGGPNPYIRWGGECTRVIKTSSTHWKMTNSTVMTFAARAEILREDEKEWRRCVSGKVPKDFKTFTRLTQSGRMRLTTKKRMLISPLPGRATHGETDYLSPFVDWKRVAKLTAYIPERADEA